MVKLGIFKKLQATDSCCSLTGVAAVGTMTGAMVVTGSLVNSRLGTIVGSADGESVDTAGDVDGVSVGAVVRRFVGIIVLLGVAIFDVGVVVVCGMVDADGGGTLLDVVVDDVSSLPLQFPVPQ